MNVNGSSSSVPSEQPSFVGKVMSGAYSAATSVGKSLYHAPGNFLGIKITPVYERAQQFKLSNFVPSFCKWKSAPKEMPQATSDTALAHSEFRTASTHSYQHNRSDSPTSVTELNGPTDQVTSITPTISGSRGEVAHPSEDALNNQESSFLPIDSQMDESAISTGSQLGTVLNTELEKGSKEKNQISKLVEFLNRNTDNPQGSLNYDAPAAINSEIEAASTYSDPQDRSSSPTSVTELNGPTDQVISSTPKIIGPSVLKEAKEKYSNLFNQLKTIIKDKPLAGINLLLKSTEERLTASDLEHAGKFIDLAIKGMQEKKLLSSKEAFDFLGASTDIANSLKELTKEKV